MSLAIVYSRASAGIAAPLVTVEAHISRGMPKFNIVGLPEAAVKESKDRVRSALLNTEFEFPRGRITINLAPADLPKEGGRFDLPIALGILAASEQLPLDKFATHEFTGELALSGELRAVRGILPVVLNVVETKRTLILPEENAHEAALVQQADVLVAKHLLEVCAYLKNENTLPTCPPLPKPHYKIPLPDLADVRGQEFARRALEIAAAGKHSILFIGPPGTGKTMLASRLPSILPELTHTQAIEVAALNSITHKGFDSKQWQVLPFRAPHHTASNVALVGGGRPPKPGEISLAHHGVLFLDELPEFGRPVLESLREPLESGMITISRVAYQTVFPAQFQLIAAMNPCPCGFFGSQKLCRCTEEQITRYHAKLSGPLLDRIDMHITVPTLPATLLTQQHVAENSASVKTRVLAARERQTLRQQKCNAELSVRDLQQQNLLTSEAQQVLSEVMQKFNFSARIYHRLVRLARTLADMAASPEITSEHVCEALSYRCLDRTKILN